MWARAAEPTRANLALVLEELQRRKRDGKGEEQPDARVVARLDPGPDKDAGSSPPREDGDKAGAEEAVTPPPSPSGTEPDPRQQPGAQAGGGGASGSW